MCNFQSNPGENVSEQPKCTATWGEFTCRLRADQPHPKSTLNAEFGLPQHEHRIEVNTFKVWTDSTPGARPHREPDKPAAPSEPSPSEEYSLEAMHAAEAYLGPAADDFAKAQNVELARVLDAFAEKAVAAERERLLAEREQQYKWVEVEARRQEREACAKIATDIPCSPRIAAAIRARGAK